MIFINEWLPNPAGSDTAGEWVELFNSGQSGVSLAGWSLKTGNGKKIFLKGERIGAGAYLVLKRSEVKFTLRNTGETISLYDTDGALVDQSGFLGTAPEGKSFARQSSSAGNDSGFGKNTFVFSEPTPGLPNAVVSGENFLMNNNYPFGQPLHSPLGHFEIAGLSIGLGFLLAFFITLLLKRNDYLSNLFFGWD